MPPCRNLSWSSFLLAATLVWIGPEAAAADRPAKPKYPNYPSETPAEFKPSTVGFDHERREVMIPMRDGVKLHTVILVPKGARRAPMLLTRTPYDANGLTTHAQSPRMAAVLQGYDNIADVIEQSGYIRVVQDVRGKYGSEGDYVMNRPFRGPLNPTPVDHATDTWDTLEWLVKHVPESNGRVGIIGISYDGYLSLTALVDPHPALKVSVPMNPMVDGWMGDDWFHHGAFRQINLPYMLEQIVTRDNSASWWHSHADQYDEYLAAGSAGALGKARGLEQSGFWRKITAHPAYDAFWQQQAMDKLLAAQPLKVPTMVVHGWWDQEDIYGAPAVYRALEAKDTNNDRVYFVAGPWNHGQQIDEASRLGAIQFDANTALQFRRDVLRPFLDHHLLDAAPRHAVPPVVAFETGSNRWQSLSRWPAGCDTGCSTTPKPLYLRAEAKLSFDAPAAGEAAESDYVSDPAKPVPFTRRPIRAVAYDDEAYWPKWLVDDQRDASSRTDVLTFVSEPLAEPLKIAGEPVAQLFAATSGTDSDWVVKLIDVYPDETPRQPQMGGYQLMVSADIFRGRYRESYEQPKPLAANAVLPYRIPLPHANHVFGQGHRLMVQIQSTWFPLYDRNPQTFVPNIFFAQPGDYRKATQRIAHAPGAASHIVLPVVESQ